MKTVKELIEENREAVLSVKTREELRCIIESIGCATQHKWKRAVEAVKAIGGLDYYQLKKEQEEREQAGLQRLITYETTLFVDAKASRQRFAICDRDGKPVWHGVFFVDDRSFSFGDRNEQSACECASARKAIWLSSKIKEALNEPAIRLNLNVDAQWLTSGSGKATVLLADAKRLKVELNMRWIPGATNPADQWTVSRGFRRWNDNDLSSLAQPLLMDKEHVAAQFGGNGHFEEPSAEEGTLTIEGG